VLFSDGLFSISKALDLVEELRNSVKERLRNCVFPFFSVTKFIDYCCMRIRLLLVGVIILVLQSCTITKCYHSLGFHIEWNHQVSPKSKSELSFKKADPNSRVEIGVDNSKTKSNGHPTNLESSEIDDLKSSFTTPRTGLQNNTVLSHQIQQVSKRTNPKIGKPRSTSIKKISTQLPEKKERKVGIGASFFLILGSFLILYSLLGIVNVWAALGYFVLGFFAICIFLIIVAVKAIVRRSKRSKQTS